MANYQQILDIQRRRLLKALQHLEYSYKKIIRLPADLEKLDEELLETWESFAARFARVSDLFLSKYLRTFVLIRDPGFNGSFRDFINQAEKLGLIINGKRWLAIRELRNVAAHEYTEEDLAAFFERLKEECPLLLELKDKIQS